MTNFILDSGDPNEYRQIAELANLHEAELWGGTTNPSLIAKKLAGRRVTSEEAFALQKDIVLELTSIVPGAVSAEVYADLTTTAQEMVAQGKEIASWHERVFVKLPTTLEGFRARTALRKEKIPTNNTLVFSQQQIFAICLHEKIIQAQFGPLQNSLPTGWQAWPPFISPFVGRLDDQGENGMDLVSHGMHLKDHVGADLWMLEASVRTLLHFKQGLRLGVELITAPTKVYQEWFALSEEQQEALISEQQLPAIPPWQPAPDLLTILTVEDFIQALETKKLDITHPLTDKGIIRFTEDWKTILV